MSPSTAMVPGTRETSAAVCSSPSEAHEAMSPTASSVRAAGAAGAVVTPAWPATAIAPATTSAVNLCRGDTGEQHLGDLDRVQRRSLSQVVAREEEREAVDRALVLADPPHEHLVDAGGVLRGGELRQPQHAHARSLTQDRVGILRRQGLLELDPDRLGVAHEHGHAHAGGADREVGQLEDLARLRAKLRLLVRLDALPIPVHHE